MCHCTCISQQSDQWHYNIPTTSAKVATMLPCAHANANTTQNIVLYIFVTLVVKVHLPKMSIIHMLVPWGWKHFQQFTMGAWACFEQCWYQSSKIITEYFVLLDVAHTRGHLYHVHWLYYCDCQLLFRWPYSLAIME